MTEFDRVPDPIVRLDAERRIVEANAAAAKLAGSDPNELVGKARAMWPRLDGQDGLSAPPPPGRSPVAV